MIRIDPHCAFGFQTSQYKLSRHIFKPVLQLENLQVVATKRRPQVRLLAVLGNVRAVLSLAEVDSVEGSQSRQEDLAFDRHSDCVEVVFISHMSFS